MNNAVIRNISNNISKYFNKLVFAINIAIFGIVTVCSLFLSSNYDFEDYPYFQLNDWTFLIYIILAVVFLIIYMLIGSFFSWSIWVCFVIYAIISSAYIAVIPLEPFSDMKSAYDIAVNGLRDDYGYLSLYNNQIPLVIYLWIITGIFGKSIIVPKFFNIVCNIITLFFIYKIYEVSDFPKSDNNKNKAVLWFGSLFIPVIMYVNHIYNDILFTALTAALVYLVVADFESKLRYIIICLLSVIQYLIRPSGIIYIMAIALYIVIIRKQWKKSLLYIIVTISIIAGAGRVNKLLFNVDGQASFPVWSYIQMGINEDEFGFQDGTHSSEWTMKDCVDKYRELGLIKVLKIWAEKELWMWSEGTYQAERYGLGDSAAIYSCDNRINESLRDIKGSGIRIFFEKIMKAQYYVYMILAFTGLLFLRGSNTVKLMLYIICGFFFFYLIWEIKSRYIFSLWPFIIIIAYNGMLKVIPDRLSSIIAGNRNTLLSKKQQGV